MLPGRLSDDVLAAALPRAARLAMAAAAQVVPPGSEAGDTDAVVLGSAWASVDPLADFVRVAAREGEDRVFPMAFPNTVVSVHAGYVGALLGLTGPVLAPCGPHAGLEAVVEGVRLLEKGRARRVLALGAEASGPVVGAASPQTGEAAAALRLSAAREPDGCRSSQINSLMGSPQRLKPRLGRKSPVCGGSSPVVTTGVRCRCCVAGSSP